MMNPAKFQKSLASRLAETKYACFTKLDQAGEIGTSIHDAIEANLNGLLTPELGPEAAEAFRSWQEWKIKAELEPLFIEQVVYSRIHEYAGTADIVARVNQGNQRVIVVGDWKSSTGLYLEHFLQVSAYRAALSEMGLLPTDEEIYGLLVKLPKTTKDKMGEPVLIAPYEMDRHFKAFLSVKAVWHALKEFEAA